MPMTPVKSSFLFKSQMSLVEMTGLKAVDLSEMITHLKTVPVSCIYYHTHHFLQQHQFLTPEPPNDFAYWVSNILQDDVAAERIASIDTVQFGTLEELRGKMISVIEEHIAENPALRKAPAGDEFHFMRCVLFALPTPYIAHDLKGFLECLKNVSIACLYNHIFEGRIRPPLGVNDFSVWLGTHLKEEALAKKIQELDPYTYTMEGLRKKIIQLIEKRLEEESHATA